MTCLGCTRTVHTDYSCRFHSRTIFEKVFWLLATSKGWNRKWSVCFPKIVVHWRTMCEIDKHFVRPKPLPRAIWTFEQMEILIEIPNLQSIECRMKCNSNCVGSSTIAQYMRRGKMRVRIWNYEKQNREKGKKTHKWIVFAVATGGACVVCFANTCTPRCSPRNFAAATETMATCA